MSVQRSKTIECPLCSGVGELSRAEILDRLGVKDYARVAQLSAEEAYIVLVSDICSARIESDCCELVI